MDKLIPIEYVGQRVLTTLQLADSYGTDTNGIVKNYNNNKDRYILGKHYFLLEGEELKIFKSEVKDLDVVQKQASSLYLWTEKGSWMQAKSLGTDQAWEAYEALVDDYYVKIEPSKPSSIEDLIIMQAQSVKDLKIQVTMLVGQVNDSSETVTVIKETFLQQDEDWRVWVKKMLNAAAKLSGDFQGIRNKSYLMLKDRARCDLDKRLRNLRTRLKDSGATKTRVDDANRLDCIEEDHKLKEIYTTIVKELSIGTL